jgi:hypothetical protein
MFEELILPPYLQEGDIFVHLDCPDAVRIAVAGFPPLLAMISTLLLVIGSCDGDWHLLLVPRLAPAARLKAVSREQLSQWRLANS